MLLSGGRDSICLLDVAVALRGRGAVIALHVDYGLRPEAGADDAAHCAALCARLDVALEVARAGRRRGGNLQAWAREVRYAGRAPRAERRRRRRRPHRHRPGRDGPLPPRRLAGPPGAARDAPARGTARSPAARVTREETAAYCTARGLPWREDAGQRRSALRAQRVRDDARSPALRDVHPAAEANVVRTAELLREEAEVLDALVDEVLGGRTEVELARLRALPRRSRDW